MAKRRITHREHENDACYTYGKDANIWERDVSRIEHENDACHTYETDARHTYKMRMVHVTLIK